MLNPNLGQIDLLKPDIYSDFVNSFNKVPFSNDLSRVTGEDAVGQSLKNLFLTGKGERFYRPSLGGNIRNLLFELDTTVDDNFEGVKFDLIQLASMYEPRAENVQIDIRAENNGVNFKVIYRVLNIPDRTFNIEFFVKRVR